MKSRVAQKPEDSCEQIKIRSRMKIRNVIKRRRKSKRRSAS